MNDEQEIANLLIRWGHARDNGNWDVLSACFHDDASIHISWMSGPASEFVKSCRKETIRPGSHMKHLITGPWIQVNGNRAFSQCHVNLCYRTKIDGHAFDLQNWFRFFDMLEKRSGIWRIFKRTGVYEKDRLDPVDPRCLPPGFFADMDLSLYPPAAGFLCYIMEREGFMMQKSNIISVYSEAERNLRKICETWLETDPGQRESGGKGAHDVY